MMKTIRTTINLKLIVLSLGILGVFTLMANYTKAQDNFNNSGQTIQPDWRVFSPSDKSFTVELPDTPTLSNTFDPEDPNVEDKNLFRCSKSLGVYQLLLSSKADLFSIGFFDVSACRRNQSEFDREAKELTSVLGGDNKDVIKNSKVYVDGLPARELIYMNGGYGRILMINANKRIFMLAYKTDANTPSKEAERIFRTFRPQKK